MRGGTCLACECVLVRALALFVCACVSGVTVLLAPACAAFAVVSPRARVSLSTASNDCTDSTPLPLIFFLLAGSEVYGAALIFYEMLKPQNLKGAVRRMLHVVQL